MPAAEREEHLGRCAPPVEPGREFAQASTSGGEAEVHQRAWKLGRAHATTTGGVFGGNRISRCYGKLTQRGYRPPVVSRACAPQPHALLFPRSEHVVVVKTLEYWVSGSSGSSDGHVMQEASVWSCFPGVQLMLGSGAASGAGCAREGSQADPRPLLAAGVRRPGATRRGLR